MHEIGLCIKLNSRVAHMFYAWSFSHSNLFPIAIKDDKYCISLETYTHQFAWSAGQSNKT